MRAVPTRSAARTCTASPFGARLATVLLVLAVAAPLCGQDADSPQPSPSPPKAENAEKEKAKDEKKSPLDELRSMFNEATELYQARDYETAAQRVAAARTYVDQLRKSARSSQAKRLLAPWVGRVTNLARKLNEKGVALPSADGDGGAGGDGDAGKQPPVSFVRDVVPIVLRVCGKCHVQKQKGELSLASYADMSKGGKSGPVIVPGDATASRLVDVLNSGEMPAKGTIKPGQIETIARWVGEGAKFDGGNPTASIISLLGTEPRPPEDEADTGNDRTGQPEVRLPGGDETVSFVRDLAPVLQKQCIGCHGSERSSADLRLDTFAQLNSGGKSGAIVTPGDADGSLLVKKLRGEVGKQMPLDRDPLPDEVIDRFVTWINEGAAFDGGNPAATLGDLIEASQLASLSDEQLAARRHERAQAAWRLAMPDVPATEVEQGDLLLLGDRPAEELETVATMAVQELTRIRQYLKLPADQSVFPGRLTVFAFARHFDYSEFGLMVESRDIPYTDQAHWRVEGLDAYVCLVISGAINPDDEDLQARLCQQLAGALIDNMGDLPEWFVAGSAREIAGRVHPQSSLVASWRKAAREGLANAAGPSDLDDDEVPADVKAVLGQSLVSFMMTGANRYERLIEQISHEGRSFDAEVQEAYGRSLDDVVAMWASDAGRRRSR